MVGLSNETIRLDRLPYPQTQPIIAITKKKGLRERVAEPALIEVDIVLRSDHGCTPRWIRPNRAVSIRLERCQDNETEPIPSARAFASRDLSTCQDFLQDPTCGSPYDIHLPRNHVCLYIKPNVLMILVHHQSSWLPRRKRSTLQTTPFSSIEMTRRSTLNMSKRLKMARRA